MTLREYIRAGHSDIANVAAALGVSEGAVHKWIYGQRQPSLDMALRIVALTEGRVSVRELTVARDAAA